MSDFLNSPLEALWDSEMEHVVPSDITREMFLKWRAPGVGKENPEDLTNPVWQWLIRSHWSAYQINDYFGCPSPFELGPGWCFSRFGQSRTSLPDGRNVYIAGEHEDYYDPNFFIYNDVVVHHPNGQITIFGYRREDFPPTDFHSATLVDDKIVIIGNLGYQDHRKPELTPIYALDVNNFVIEKIMGEGDSPGWIHRHNAHLSEDGKSIILTGGLLEQSPSSPLRHNVDEWSFHIGSRTWRRLTNKGWPEWVIRRADNKSLSIFSVQMKVWEDEIGGLGLTGDAANPLGERELTPEVMEAFKTLYSPKQDHQKIETTPEDGSFQTKQILVDNTPISFVEGHRHINVMFQGELSKQRQMDILHELKTKLEIIEQCEIALLEQGP
ncbi:MAG: hypothetical protein ACO1QB_01540 [Verrucomicrobiales bacterium]